MFTEKNNFKKLGALAFGWNPGLKSKYTRIKYVDLDRQ